MLRPFTIFSASLALLLSAPLPALAQGSQASASGGGGEAEAEDQSPLEMRAEQVVALLNGEIEPEDVFTDGFIAAVPASQFKTIATQLSSQFGAAISVEALNPPTGSRAALSIRMERAIAKGGIAIDPDDNNKISELLFRSFDPTNDSLGKVEADLKALPGKVTWFLGPIDTGSAAVTSSGAEEQMPIGSAFKLYVLATLAREVANGKRTWSDQVVLGDTRSFPSGMMQDWPKDAPVTLHTLASMMISISDNTATDTLIEELGRDVVYQTLIDSGHSQPEFNAPFLMTREMFLLKGGPEGRLRTFIRAKSDVRRQILDGIDDIATSQNEVEAAFSGPPLALDVEWFASARDIANLFRFMRETSDQEAFRIMGINPSMPADMRADWVYVGYKGGSEPGVLNLSWLLQDSNGTDHALIMNWRDDDKRFDPTTFELIAQRLLARAQ